VVTEFECGRPAVAGRTIRLPYVARAGGLAAREFLEVIELPGGLGQVPGQVRQPLLRLLSVAAGLSYFKAFAPAAITAPGGLTARERDFLDQLVNCGLGEFAYVNSLPEVFDTKIAAPELPQADGPASPARPGQGRALVAVGGGKDSIVSIEALKAAGFEFELFAVNSFKPITDTAAAAGLPLHLVDRRIDPGLLELNQAGAPNGHVPVTAVNSLLAVLSALALGFDSVVFSNEASSSAGNLVWQGRQINHQWSKSLEFERLLRQTLPAGAPQYVSLLRPLSELRIARRFAQLPTYHQVFTSCNRAFKLRQSERTSWCADCPKCRFVFLGLAPFLSRAAVLEIFGGRDMFADGAQLPGFCDLLGAGPGAKPFECVGEAAECRVALDLLRAHPDWQDHAFLARPELRDVHASPAEQQAVFTFREHEHCLPKALEAVARAI
jgi:hypothetical protein